MTNDLVAVLQRQVAILKRKTERFTWYRVEDNRYPDYCVPVIVLIPDEDDHLTFATWETTKQWVTTDTGRVIVERVTHWMYGPEIPGKKLK